MKEKDLKALEMSGLLVMWQAVISIFMAISPTRTISTTVSTTVIFVTAKAFFENRTSHCVDRRCCEGDRCTGGLARRVDQFSDHQYQCRYSDCCLVILKFTLLI